MPREPWWVTYPNDVPSRCAQWPETNPDAWLIPGMPCSFKTFLAGGLRRSASR